MIKYILTACILFFATLVVYDVGALLMLKIHTATQNETSEKA